MSKQDQSRTGRIAVLKELARMSWSVLLALGKTTVYLVPILAVGLAAIYMATHFNLHATATFIQSGMEAVPDSVWTTLAWIGRILGLLIWVKIFQEIWCIARERAKERDTDA